MHIGQAEVAALKTVDEFGMIEAEQVQNGRVQVVDVDSVYRSIETELV